MHISHILAWRVFIFLSVPVATACDPLSFVNDEPTYHFTADCSGVTTHAGTCVLTLSAGYSGGSVTCDTADGQYDVVAATGTLLLYTYDMMMI